MLFTFFVFATLHDDGDTIVGSHTAATNMYNSTIIGEHNVVQNSTNTVLIGSFLEVLPEHDNTILIGTSLQSTTTGQILLGKHSAHSDAMFVLGAGTSDVPINMLEVYANGSMVTPTFSSDTMKLRIEELESRIDQLTNAAATPCGCHVVKTNYRDQGCCTATF